MLFTLYCKIWDMKSVEVENTIVEVLKCNIAVAGFLRRGRKKDNKKTSSSSLGKAKKDEDEGHAGSDGEGVGKSKTPTPEVDEDGFSKQPERTATDPWADFNRQEKFYSSSDDSGTQE